MSIHCTWPTTGNVLVYIIGKGHQLTHTPPLSYNIETWLISIMFSKMQARTTSDSKLLWCELPHDVIVEDKTAF